ncbi:MAG: saccharopine dehydrogenase NADP-binding domain-containing protein [Elusimicrobia bacterium]|jgi:lysine 6-dehydrogenase|nr:saccharopine dehydrogenase NADP-binding domain-containing protein [Elusimicrobiota bacterium]MBK7546012.1 saccharopine dehydrogenase NADP-binding domain-containing protein [Elusimicrobiota bacterium]MBK7574889.1 saccharopine dehydrogenase NADP-binding domain-containing protein [Elusimicrobiota bacterium]MBK8423090.1 saccharopine dehydrogenase NADP-binding domain-containing protein [Elusimicrobiota bacterium]MBK9430497.1 saccharopine dehydrogenase NADP-binding domain-containing protein [Elusi
MTARHAYVVLGAGAQGLAVAHDLCVYGRAARVTLADIDRATVRAGEAFLKRVLGRVLSDNGTRLAGRTVDASRPSALASVLRGHDGVLSALPYALNPVAARAAIAARSHWVDLGSPFDTTRKILSLSARAEKSGVALVPDCGLAPGLCNILATRGIEQMEFSEDVRLYCGGLPETPRPPLGYKLVFNLDGVLGNYFGRAVALQRGRVTDLVPFSEREEIDFGPPLGVLEAFVTGGATSTAPWTHEGRVASYVFKTLRFPGHYEKIRALKDLGLLDERPVRVDGVSVVPRRLFAHLAEPRLRFPGDRDQVVLRVTVRGRRNGRPAAVAYDLWERGSADWTATQKVAGGAAAVILETLVGGAVVARGAVAVEQKFPAADVIDALRRRGLAIKETWAGEGR